MSDSISISVGIAERYASALFDVSGAAGTLEALKTDMSELQGLLSESDDLQQLINSQVYTRAEQEKAIAAIGSKAGLAEATVNTLKIMAQNRRLFVLPQFCRSVLDKISERNGEVTAEVISASPLEPAQLDALSASLKKKFGAEVLLETSVDDSLIGGLIVKVGSKMIDTSIRSKLSSLQNAIKEVG